MKRRITEEQRAQLLPRVLIVTFAMLVAALLYYFKSIWSAFSTVLTIITPFLIGFSISFLLAPVQSFLDRLLTATCFRKKNHPRIMHAISSLLSLLFLIAALSVFLSFVLPQLIQSIKSIINYITRFIQTNSDDINAILVKYNFLNIDGDSIAVAWDNIVSSQLGTVTSLLSNVIEISGSVVNGLYTFLISLITAFYFMMDKDLIGARIKKTGYAFFKEETMCRLIYWTRRANHIFTGFISGKILDSLVIGVICYICMLILGLQYPLLISCIIGVTNIIPFFGPFIGWFPCALLLLIVKPISAVWFTIFILILQQIDGNVIGPHILGDYVGVSAFSIMVVIIVGGGLFGFVGMLLAVPVYALLNAICKTIIESRLEQKGFNTDETAYAAMPEISAHVAKAESVSESDKNIPVENKEDKK